MKQSTTFKAALFLMGVFFFPQAFLHAQTDPNYHAVAPASGLAEPFSDEFKRFLTEELKGVRIVALGEATHEDGATFEHKVKLVKWLHQELGFTVLAFEYGFYGHWLINQRVAEGEPLEEAVRHAGWSRNRQSFPIYEYLHQTHQTESPLTLAGFDGEKVPDGEPNIRSLIHGLSDRVEIDLSATDSLTVDSLVSALYGGLGNQIFREFSFNGREAAKRKIEEIRNRLLSRSEHWIPELGMERFRMYDFTLQSILMDEKSKYAGTFWNIVRDKQMAERVQWLADSLYKDEKIILWGASAHFARNMVLIERELNPGDYGFFPYYQQGDWLSSEYGDSYYSIAFTAGKGKTGTILPDNHRYKAYEEIREVPPPAAESFERTLLRHGDDALYVSMRRAPSGSLFSARFTAHPLGYHRDHAPWNRIFDGFYFIREMTPIELRSR